MWMATSTEALTDRELLDAEWDLAPLVDGDLDNGAERLLSEAVAHSDAFAGKYVGKVATLDGPGLVGAMRELAVIEELVDKAGTYAGLWFSTDTADPVRGALMQKIDERTSAI